jgi:autotransporter translocation and assembly factor TamB
MSGLAKSVWAILVTLVVVLPTLLVVWIASGARGAIPLFANLINGQNIGRYGQLKLSGVVETSRGAKIEQLSLADAKGIWILVKDIDLRWNAKALLSRRLDVTELHAAQTSLLRQPVLRPRGKPRRLPIDVKIDAIETNLRVASGFLDNAPTLLHQTLGKVAFNRDNSFALKLSSQSLSGPLDIIQIDLSGTRNSPFAIMVRASGGATGIVNTLFGAPNAVDTKLNLAVSGDTTAGQATGRLISDTQTDAAFAGNWTPDGGNMEGFVAAHPQSWLGQKLVRLGGRLDVNGQAQRLVSRSRQLVFVATSPTIAMRFEGPFDFHSLSAKSGGTLTLERGDLATLTDQRLSGLATGAFKVEGQRLQGAIIGSFEGSAKIANLKGFGVAFSAVNAPIDVVATSSRIKILANLEGQLTRANDPRLASFGTNPKLGLEIERNRPAAIWYLRKAELTGRGLRASITGDLSQQSRQLKGNADVANVVTLVPMMSGPAQLAFDLSQRTGAPWQGKATLRARELKSSSQIVSGLIGDQLTAELTPSGGDLRYQFGWEVRTGKASARGTLNLRDRVSLRGIWGLKAPLAISRVSISGQGRAGPIGNLAYGPAGFAVGGENARIVIGGWNMENARFLGVGGTAGKPITASISGIAPLGPASISGVITPKAGVVTLTDVLARHAGLQAVGAGRSTGNTFDGLFDLKIEPGAVLVSGASSGRLGIAVRDGKVGLAADVALSEAAFANAPLQVPTGRLRASGLLGALSLAFDGDVRAGGQQGHVNLKGSADLDGRETSLILNGSGDIGGRRFVLSQPFRAVPLGTKARLTGQAIWGDYRLGLDGQIRNRGLDVRFIELSGPALTASLAGRLGGGDYNLRGTARVSSLATFNQRLRGSASGNLTIQGSDGQNWRAQILGQANDLSVGSTDFDTLLGARPKFDLTARAAPGRDVSGAWKLTGKQLSGEGSISPPRAGQLSNARGTWRIDGPVKLGGADIVGRVNGTISLQDAAVLVTATSPNLTFAGQAWRDLRASAQIRDILNLAEIPVEAAAIGSLGPLQLTTQYRQGPTPSLQPFVIIYGGVEGRGAIFLGADGPSGTLGLQASPGAILTSGRAQGSVALSQSNLGMVIDARLGLTNVTIERAGMARLSGNIAAKGPLKDLTASVDASFDLRGTPASARLTGRYTQTGDVNRFLINGGGMYQGAPWRIAEPFLVTAQNRTNRASGRLVWRDADLDFDSQFDPNGLNLNANLKDAPASLFAQGQTRLDGRVNGTLALRSRGRNVSGDGRLVAVGLKPVAAQTREAIDGSLVAQLRDGALTLRGTANNPRGLRATGDARLPVVTSLSPFRLEIVRTGAVSGQFALDGPVEAIAKLALSRNSTASGTVTARGQLSGTFASPQLQGRAQVENAAISDTSLGVRVTQANAIVNFLGPVADIETFTASDGRGGKLQLGGRISLTQGASWRLSGQMDQFQLLGSTEALIVASGPWSLASNGDQTSLGGDLVLNNARVGIPAGSNRADALRVREINRPGDLGAATPPPVAKTTPSTQRASTSDLGLDLRLTSAGNARVVSRGFDGYFDLGLAVKGSLKRPQVQGRADLVRGRFDLAGRSFDLTKGSVAFATPLETSRIEFIAERETADITALAKIKGTLGRPVFTLESTPPSPQDEILSRILFGRNVAALSLPQAAQLTLGISSLATGNQLDPTARLGQALGLERFSLGTESGGFSGFTAGLRLVRDVYVEVTTGGEDGTVTMLEWRPRPRVQVQVTTSQKRESAVSVRLRSKD